MKKTILKTGLFRKANENNETKGELNLDSWLSRILTSFGVAHTKPCCPQNDDSLPLRYSSNSEEISFLDGTTWVPLIRDVVDVKPIYLHTAQQSLSGAGAVNVTSYLTMLTSTGAAQAITLADGTHIGQLKKIQHLVDGGSMVLTPTNLSGGTTITFTSVGEYVILQWNGTDWVVLELNNNLSATLPVLA